MPRVPRIIGVRFHPTEVELINYLKRFLRGQSFSTQCPIRFAEIYGDQPPSVILGEDKVGYFISLLKKRKNSDERYRRTCADGTWTGQNSGKPIKNRKGSTVVGFRRNLKYTTKEKKQNSTIRWLMREYFVGDDFFKENDIAKQDFVVCRIKKYINEKKVNDVAMTEQDVAGIVKVMLPGPQENYCNTQAAIMDETKKLNEEPDCQQDMNCADDVLIDIDDLIW
ncbi:NAC domain-containing protein 78-like [Lycium barbarum]|uniref:NAC domain-containing protein 78-like n=1 Tax=Lycium barbarum TaxID=112863 RepID=UPI00293EAC80|nr:NAC domain-containing protein 78-like [Lycium barbarum]